MGYAQLVDAQGLTDHTTSTSVNGNRCSQCLLVQLVYHQNRLLRRCRAGLGSRACHGRLHFLVRKNGDARGKDHSPPAIIGSRQTESWHMLVQLTRKTMCPSSKWYTGWRLGFISCTELTDMTRVPNTAWGQEMKSVPKVDAK